MSIFSQIFKKCKNMYNTKISTFTVFELRPRMPLEESMSISSANNIISNVSGGKIKLGM